MLLAILVAAVLILPPVGQRTISTSHEARFGVLARDITERGAWFAPRVGGEVYRNKPPLYPWSIAALSLVPGRVSEATAQLPVVAAAIGAVLFTFLLGTQLFHRRAGLWAALILTTSYDFFAHSQLILPDMLVVLFATVAGYAFWRAMSKPSARGMLLVFYGALGLGVFAKGPVGLLPLLVAFIWLWTERGPRGLGRLWSSAGVGVFVGLTAIWLGPFLALGSRSFVEDVVRMNWLDWFVGLPSLGELKDLAGEGLLGFLPWTLVLPLALARGVREWRLPQVRFALLWLLVPLALITLSLNPRARYLLPIHPAAALLIAWWADTHGSARTIAGRALAWTSLVGALAAVIAPAWLTPSPIYFVPTLSWAVIPLSLGTAIVGGALFWGLRAGRPRVLVHGVVTGMVVVLGWGVWPYSTWVNETQDFRRLAATLASHSQDTTAATFVSRLFFQVDFYTDRALHRLRTVQEFNDYVARPERPVVLVNGVHWEAYREQLPEGLRVLETGRVGAEAMFIVKLADAHAFDTTEPRGQP